VSDLMDVKVGDELVVSGRHRQKAEREVVTKVGRRYLYIGDGWRQLKIDRATGHHPPRNGYSVEIRAHTPEQWERSQQTAAARQVIDDAGLSFKLGAGWPDDRVLALADWLATEGDDS